LVPGGKLLYPVVGHPLLLPGLRIRVQATAVARSMIAAQSTPRGNVP